MKEFGDCTGLAFIVARPLTRVTVPVATHAGELVVMKVGPWRAVCVTCHTTQQCVWIQHKSLLALGALVCIWAGAAHTSLVALCTKSNRWDCVCNGHFDYNAWTTLCNLVAFLYCSYIISSVEKYWWRMFYENIEVNPPAWTQNWFKSVLCSSVLCRCDFHQCLKLRKTDNNPSLLFTLSYKYPLQDTDFAQDYRLHSLYALQMTE